MVATLGAISLGGLGLLGALGFAAGAFGFAIVLAVGCPVAIFGCPILLGIIGATGLCCLVPPATAGLCGAGGLLGTLGAAFGGAGIIGIVQSICITITGILGAIFTCISGIIAPDSTANMLRTFRDYVAS